MSGKKLSKLDIAVLCRLIENEKNSFNNAVTLAQLNELLPKVKRNTLYNHINYLRKINFMGEGAMVSKRKTYYILDLGINDLKMKGIIK